METEMKVAGQTLNAQCEDWLVIEQFLMSNYRFRRNVLNGKVEFAKMEAEGVVSPVTEVHCSYKKTTTFQDEIAVEVFVEDISALKLRIGYVMTCRGEVVFTGSSVHCFIENGRPVAFGKRFPGFIEALAPYRRQA